MQVSTELLAWRDSLSGRDYDNAALLIEAVQLLYARTRDLEAALTRTPPRPPRACRCSTADVEDGRCPHQHPDAPA